MGAFAIVVLLARAPLTAGMVCCQVLERGFVGCAVATEAAGVRGPRVVGRARARAAAGPAGPAGPAAETAAGPVGLGDLGRGVAHGRADIIDLDLVDGPLLAFPGLIGPLAEPTVDDHPHAPLQALGHVAPDVAGEEQAVAVLPLTAGAVPEPGGRGDAELGDRLAGGGIAQFRIVDQVAGDRDLGVACCHRVLLVLPWMFGLSVRGYAAAQWRSGRRTLVRRTASFRPSWRSSS